MTLSMTQSSLARKLAEFVSISIKYLFRSIYMSHISQKSYRFRFLNSTNAKMLDSFLGQQWCMRHKGIFLYQELV